VGVSPEPADHTPSPADVGIGVVIVTYNSAGVIRGCLESLRHQEPPARLTTVVVDNGSTDGTRALVRAEFPEVRLVEAPRNGGFSYGTNLGLRALGVLERNSRGRDDGAAAVNGEPRSRLPGDRFTTAEQPPTEAGRHEDSPTAHLDFVLFLNPDTELPADALRRLVPVLAARPRVGAVSPRLERADGSLDKACHRGFPTLCHELRLDERWPRSRVVGGYNLSHLPPDQPTTVDCVAGAFMLVRAEAVWQVGAWDEAFFAYGEDIDYCLRLRQTGWTIWYEPSVRVLHLKGAASQPRSLPMLREFYRAMHVYYCKHHAPHHPWLLRLLIRGGIEGFYRLALLRQMTRPAGQRWVGSARPVARVRGGR
jgi:N-acetylglucosaminyl-diphospho-decaprenol L-rhamnosyltransferase